MKKLIGFIVLGFLLSSCAFHSGMMTSNPNYSSPDYELSSMAIGTSGAAKFLGIGGLAKEALVLEAKKNMYTNFPLEKGQSYSNLSVDFKDAYFILFSKTTVTISADIVQYNKTGEPGEEYQPEFNQIRKNQRLSKANIDLGDTIMTYAFNRPHDNIVIKILPGDSYLIMPIQDTITQIKRISRKKIYLTRNTENKFFPFKIHQEVWRKSGGKSEIGKIIGIGENNAIIKKDKGDKVVYRKRNYDHLKINN